MEVNYHTIKNENVADFLVLTVTDIETDVFLRYLKPITEDESVLTTRNEGRIYSIGRIGNFNVIHTRCTSMGSVEAGSSTLTTSNALNDWACVKAVAMVGIAFGMYGDEDDENQQHFSDVLVSKSIYPYENQKLVEKQTKYRGEWHSANSSLVNAFEEVAKNWSFLNLNGEHCKIEVCDILSGEKLFDDKASRNQLKASFQSARGGEMEGIGLASACNDAGKPWVLVKAICDFADGNKADNKDNKQENAATSACVAFEAVCNRVDLLKFICETSKSSFFYRLDSRQTEIILFDNYTEENEPYYLKRKIDEQLGRITQVKGCWIYGKSGVGKTIALQRVLTMSKSNYCYIALAEFVGKSINLIFRHIYEELCDKFGEESDSKVQELHHLSRAIGAIIDKNIGGGVFYLFIEEIPLSASGSEEFKQFVQQLCAIIISNSIQVHKTQVKFILSSISSPLVYVEEYQQKVNTKIKFIEMSEWTLEECVALWNLISNELGFKLSGISIEEYIKRMNMSPRLIKDCIRTHVLWNKSIIDEDSLNDL